MTIQNEIESALEQRNEQMKAYAGLGDIEAWLRSCIEVETFNQLLLDELAPVFRKMQEEIVRSRHLTDEFEQPVGSSLQYERSWRMGNWRCAIIADYTAELGSIEHVDDATGKRWIFSHDEQFLITGASLNLNKNTKH